jgi:hypothetical protein
MGADCQSDCPVKVKPPGRRIRAHRIHPGGPAVVVSVRLEFRVVAPDQRPCRYSWRLHGCSTPSCAHILACSVQPDLTINRYFPAFIALEPSCGFSKPSPGFHAPALELQSAPAHLQSAPAHSAPLSQSRRRQDTLRRQLCGDGVEAHALCAQVARQRRYAASEGISGALAACN